MDAKTRDINGYMPILYVKFLTPSSLQSLRFWILSCNLYNKCHFANVNN